MEKNKVKPVSRISTTVQSQCFCLALMQKFGHPFIAFILFPEHVCLHVWEHAHLRVLGFVPWIISDVLRNSGDPQDEELVLWTSTHI